VSRRRNVLSERVKAEIAKELGVYNTVSAEGGWGSVTSRDCGNVVKKALEMADKNFSGRENRKLDVHAEVRWPRTKTSNRNCKRE